MTGFFSSANYHICDCLPVTIVWMVRTHFGLCVSLLDLVVWRRRGRYRHLHASGAA